MVETKGVNLVQGRPSAATADSGGPVPIAADGHYDDEKEGQGDHPGSKEQGLFEQLPRRPSFMQNLADSRESQFQMQRLSELERYFVCGTPRHTRNEGNRARADEQDVFNSMVHAI